MSFEEGGRKAAGDPPDRESATGRTSTGAERLLTFSDLSVGQTFTSSTYEMRLEEIVAFAAAYDPQDHHLDAKAAERGFFGTLVASGWHTVAVTMRLFVQATPIAGGLIGAGVSEIAWQRPVRPGDMLTVTATVEAMQPSRARPDIGKVVMRVETFNQERELVQSMRPTILVPRPETRT